MKDTDFESKLRDTPLQPRRSLHRDFTKQAMIRIAADQKKSRIHNVTIALQRIFTMKTLSFTRPVITAAAILGITVAGGTAYAIVKGWPQAQSFFADESSLQNGNKEYSITSKDCVANRTQDVMKNPDWANKSPSNRVTKFEVSPGTNVDVKDLEVAALAICNEGASVRQLDVIQKAINPNLSPAESKRYYNHNRLVVTAIDGTTISGQVEQSVYDPLINDTKFVAYSRTYQLDANVKTYDYDVEMQLADIKIGDNVDMLLFSEDFPSYLEKANRSNGTQQDVSVVGLIKTPAYMGRLQASQMLTDKYGDAVKVESVTVE